MNVMDDHAAARCRTCLFWRQGWGPIATATRVPDANPDLGACELEPPIVQSLNGGLQSVFPATHADRCCSMWIHDGDGGPGSGNNVIPVDFGSAA